MDRIPNCTVLHWDLQEPQQTAACLMPAIRGVCKPSPFPIVRFLPLPEVDRNLCDVCEGGAWIEASSLEEAYRAIAQLPPRTRLVAVKGLGVFACCSTVQETESLLVGWQLGALPSSTVYSAPGGRMKGRVVIVTGGAQGLGKGISSALLAEGARVILADVNLSLAQETARAFCEQYGDFAATAMYADVTDDCSVETLCRETVLRFGGIDVMFSNAGIVIAGDLEQMTSSTMAKVADVNYIGYFRCAKYASRYMKIQSAFDRQYTADILNTSSIAGLVAYSKNFAYCGSKFAVLGLTQCFAKELLPYGIKVNSICPGNYYDGPLWNDPEKGLFVKYLQAGKIPNGKTVQDSIEFYMNREPFRRGCTPEDIAAGVLYCIEQQFETGIALPVTGGLAMGGL